MGPCRCRCSGGEPGGHEPTIEWNLQQHRHQQRRARCEEEDGRNKSSEPISDGILKINFLSVARSHPQIEKTHSVVHTSCDTQSSAEIVNDGPDSSLELQRNPGSSDAAHYGNHNDEEHIEPVDVLVPVLQRQFRICNVYFLGIDRPGGLAGRRVRS